MVERTAAAWEAGFTAYVEQFAGLFYRSEVRGRMVRYVRGLLGPVARRNGWQMAEAIGDAHPIGVQRLFYEARWDADAVRDALVQFVIAHFGAPDGILVLDETGFVKKGTKSVGVQRQYSGTAGKVENCQLGVFLTYATPRGHVVLDRRLYLPQVWTEHRARCAEAGVPAAVAFQTIPALGLAMIEAAAVQGVPFAWVTADEAYGKDPQLLAALEAAARHYVVAVAKTTPIWAAPPREERGPRGGRRLGAGEPAAGAAEALVAAFAPAAWQRLSVGDGAKGPRVYDWAAQQVVASRDAHPGPTLWLLARRSLDETGEIAYYLSNAPADTPLATLAVVAGTRWTVEQWFEEAKGETGLDQYEVRTWRGWHRHITLSMLAHTFLAWQRWEAGGKGDAAGRCRADRAERPGDPPVAGVRAAAPRVGVGLPAAVVTLATAASSPRPARPLSPSRTATT